MLDEGPQVPFNVMELVELLVDIVPDAFWIPYVTPEAPEQLAVMTIGLFAPVVEKFVDMTKPALAPAPWIPRVAVIDPAVVKEEPTLIPCPPPLPPWQVAKTTGPLPVKKALKLTPWPDPPDPPVPLKLTVPVVAGVHAVARETP